MVRGRKITRKGQQLKAIKWYVSRKYRVNVIQKKLSGRKLGLRRKILLSEIRSIKKIKITKEKRIRYIPKKYRKKIIAEQLRLKELDMIYRVSYIIRDIPVHSRPLKRNYLGFRLQAFSYDAEYLLQNNRYLKQKLIEETNNYLKFKVFENFNWSHKIGIEKPTHIVITNAKKFNNVWIFRVEQEGIEVYSRDGRI